MPARLKTSPANAAFLTGPGDLLVFLCGLEQIGGDIRDWVIALMGRVDNIPADMIDTCRVMAGGGDVVFFDFCSPSAQLDFFTRFGRAFDHLAISHLFGRFELALLEELKWQSLILTENGIATYLPPFGRIRMAPDDPTLRLRFAPQMAILPLSAHPEIDLPGYLRRQPDLDVISHDPKAYARVLRRLRDRFDLGWVDEAFAQRQTCAIVAGTSLARVGIVDAEEERRAHQRCIAGLGEGPDACDLVIWKPHPRAGAQGAIAPAAGARMITIDNTLPLELYFPTDRSDVPVHSTASSSLLTAELFHGLPPVLIPVEMKLDRHPHAAFVRQLYKGRGAFQSVSS